MAQCGMCGAPRSDTARFCSSCGERLEPIRPEQRRLATMLFCDVIGSTAMGERLDAESVREVMLRFFAQMRRIIEAHGGTTQKFIGDAVLAVFGVPVAHDDDAVRAVAAALEMRAHLVPLNAELQSIYGVELTVRMGINSGVVVAGDALRDDALVLGDSVNVAARLEQAAPAGEILIGEATRLLVRDQAAVEPVEPIVAKGKSEPLVAHRLLSLAPGRPVTRGESAPMIGRDEPLARLLDTFATVTVENRAQLLVVEGEAGIGKSRLAREFERLTPATFLHGRCLHYGEGVTYWALGEVIRELAGIREEDLPQQAEDRLIDAHRHSPDGAQVARYLAQVLGLRAGSASAQEINWATRRALALLAERGPVVVLLDDLHWAEATLLDFIEQLVSGLATSPVLVLGLARPELNVRRPDWPHLALDHLSDDQVATLIANLADLDSDIRYRLIERSAGSPLFVEELVAAVIETPDLELPPTLEAVLTARLDRFSRSERYVLERGAVEGQVFHLSAVAELIANKDDVDLHSTLEGLLEAGVIGPEAQVVSDDPTFRFRHILIRDAVYDGIPRRIRAELHENLAAWNAHQHGARLSEYEELLAYHLQRAYECRAEMGIVDDHTNDLARRAAVHLRSAALRAHARSDLPSAIALLTEAVNVLDRLPDEQLVLYSDLAEVHYFAGDSQQSRALTDHAISSASDVQLTSVVLSNRVVAAMVRLSTDVEVHAEDVMELANNAVDYFTTAEDHWELARAWALLADTHWHLCRSDPMEHGFRQAVSHYQRTEHPNPPDWIIRRLAMVYYLGPTPVDLAIERCYELEGLTNGSNAMTQIAITENVAALEAMRGNLDLARDMFAKCRLIGEEFSLRWEMAAIGMMAGPVEIHAGNLEGAVEVLTLTCRELQALGITAVLSTAAAFLARAYEQLGDVAHADEWISVSEQTASPSDIASQLLWRGIRARLLSRQGHHDQAVALAQMGCDLAYGTDFTVQTGEAELDLAECLRRADLLDAANDALLRAKEHFASKGHRVLVRATDAHLAQLAHRA